MTLLEDEAAPVAWVHGGGNERGRGFSSARGGVGKGGGASGEQQQRRAGGGSEVGGGIE